MSDKVKAPSKKEMFTLAKAYCEAVGPVDGFDVSGLVEFFDNEVALLDKRAAKAKERAANKPKAEDPLMDAVAAVLTDEPATAEQILDMLDPSFEASLAKVRYRCTALVKAGVATKSEVAATTPDGKATKHAAYSLT